VPTPAPAPSKPLTAEQEAAARAIVDQKLFEITGVRPGTPSPSTAIAQPQTTPRSTTPPAGQVTATTTTPATQTVTPMQATRSEKLAALLQAYKADRITPIEYHSQRAKIIAETKP
jgi:hypothetical protein